MRAPGALAENSRRVAAGPGTRLQGVAVIQTLGWFDKTIEEVAMLRWALGFFLVALAAALLGFTGIAVAAAGIAKILFYLFLILFLVTLVGHVLRRA
jgi:uncharacterized membrane protein YtjA (UPF0391 family)